MVFSETIEEVILGLGVFISEFEFTDIVSSTEVCFFRNTGAIKLCPVIPPGRSLFGGCV